MPSADTDSMLTEYTNEQKQITARLAVIEAELGTDVGTSMKAFIGRGDVIGLYTIGSTLVAKICKRKGINMFILSMGFFIIFWLFMFFYQFRSPNHYDGRIDMKEYAFCSNITVELPTWIVRVLFLNARLTKLPIVIVVGQICNYIFMIFYFLWNLLENGIKYSYAMNYITVWFAFLVTILLVMCVDFEIFYHKNKWKI